MPDQPEVNDDTNSPTVPTSDLRSASLGGEVDLPSVEELSKRLVSGAYEVTSFLGAGGMGAVYKGTQLRLKRQVAIKFMRQDAAADAEFSARFLREAHTLARLSHQGIVNVIDCGKDGEDLSYIIMEFVDGTNLGEVMRSGPLPQERVLELLPQLCDALQFAHDNGIIHRDIKPSNILIGRNGRVKLVDFGLARPLEAGSTLQSSSRVSSGTPFYAAPEQLTPGAPLDHRADIFALGVLLYQMLTGRLPRGAWRPPSQTTGVSQQWDAIVKRAIEQRPEDRYASVTELCADAMTIAGTSMIEEDPVDSRSNRIGIACIMGAALCLFGWLAQDFWSPESRPVAPAAPAAPAIARPPSPSAIPVAVVQNELPSPRPAPTPAIWIDATEQVREAAKQAGTGSIQGDWLIVTKLFNKVITGDKMLRNAVARMTFKGSAGLIMRWSMEGCNYQTMLVDYGMSQHSWDATLKRRALFDKTAKYEPSFDLQAEHELVVAVEGDLISAWLDGRLTLTQRDSTTAQGGISVNMSVAGNNKARFPHIRKVEYGELPASAEK